MNKLPELLRLVASTLLKNIHPKGGIATKKFFTGVELGLKMGWMYPDRAGDMIARVRHITSPVHVFEAPNDTLTFNVLDLDLFIGWDFPTVSR